jgi:hypothetical protein
VNVIIIVSVVLNVTPVNTGAKGPELLGVTETELDAMLLPFVLTAFTVILYVTPFVSPVIVIGLEIEPLDT